MPNRFEIDRNGIAELLVGREMHNLSRHFAEEAKEFAKAISPVSTSRGSRKTHYIDNFEIHAGHVENLTIKHRTERACADLVNTSRYAEAVEQGWQKGIGRQPDHPGYFVLTQTAAFIGDPYVGTEP